MNDRMIYIHFPFCKRKCGYCDFYSVTENELTDLYIDRVISDIEAISKKYEKTSVSSVYIGGGTPSLMGCDNAEKLLESIFENFNVKTGAEITFEVNPESVTDEILNVLKNGGVNRISMGAQSHCDAELSMIGRIHTAKDTERAVEKIRKNGFDNLNLDLIYSLPYQSMDLWKDNLNKTVLLKPEHVSFYALSLSENVLLYKKRDTLPNEEIQREMYLYACDFLNKNGYVQYEISNAAKPGFESRHNMGYWENREYFGIGAGAHSYIDNKRFSTVSNVKKYVFEDNRESLFEYDDADGIDEKYIEFVFLSIRTSKGINFKLLEEKYGADRKNKAEKILSELALHGLSQKTNSGYRLTPEGYFVSDAIITKII